MPRRAAVSLIASASCVPHASLRTTETNEAMPAASISPTSMSPCRATLTAVLNMLSPGIASCGASDEGLISRTLSSSSGPDAPPFLMFSSPWLVVGPT